MILAWETIAQRTISTENPTPIPPSALYYGFVSIAVYDAVVSIRGGGRQFYFHQRSPRSAAADVAAAAAAHRILAAYFPASVAHLDADYHSFLAGRPHNRATAAGMQAGEAAAAATISHRLDDGRNAARALEPGTTPGAWRPTPPAFAPMLVPWLGFVRPLVPGSSGRFALPGPDPLTSAAYARDFNEVKAYGSNDSAVRSDDQKQTARFWNANSVAQYRNALAQQVSRRGLDIVAGARAFAVLSSGTADALVGCWRAKYDFALWRPVTAIPLADTDGNPATIADSAWQPLVDTPPYPEYVSGHACITGAATSTFRYLFGGRSINLDISSSVTGTSRHYDSTAALDQETMNARVWLGLHFRKAVRDGNQLGHRAANRSINYVTDEQDDD